MTIGAPGGLAATHALSGTVGVDAVTPVVVVPGTTGDAAARLVGIDPATLPATSLGGRAVPAGALTGLRSGAARALLAAGAEVPAGAGRPGRGPSLTARATVVVQVPPGLRRDLAVAGLAEVDALVVGAGDVVAAVPLGEVQPGASARLAADLPAGTRRLLGLQVRVPTAVDPGTGEPWRTTLDVEDLALDSVPVRFGAPLRARTTGPSADRFTSMDARPLAGGVRLDALSAGGNAATVTGLVVAADLSDLVDGVGAVPAVLPAALAAALDVRPGGDVAVTAESGVRLAGRVVAVLPELPEPLPDDVAAGAASVGVAAASIAQDAAAVRGAPVLVDAASLAVLDVLAARAPRAPRQWWVCGTAPPATLAAAARPAVLPGAGPPTVTTRGDVEAALAADPLIGGLTRLLRLAALGLAVVAVAAAVLGEAVGGRRRRGELAVLRALGLAPGELRRLLAAEQLLVVGASLLTGALAGVALAYVVAPVLAGPAVSAPVAVRPPWVALAAGLLAVAAAVAAASAVRGARAERLDVAAVLREGVR